MLDPNDARPASPPRWSRRVALAVLLAALAAALPAVPANAGKVRTRTFEAEGAISAANPFTLRRTGITQTEFTRQCAMPATQGLDAFVIEVPGSFSGAPAGTTLVGTDLTGIGDFDMYYYDDACDEIGDTSTAEPAEYGVMPAGTKFVLVGPFVGADLEFTFTAVQRL